ncbi:hypothetical protein PHISCL_09641 [Aspergillus sclerotialis]|uniref:Uncharacterized protein n=1 Tax=Aspergillus sclerotialis TaxID=2070753 RepID=A0A3A2Z9Q5_9EURO|nr:hypothetical protein PHISCL_09641 [Aspergillus sclerotialis]
MLECPAADDIFVINVKFRVIICRPCQHAIRRDQVEAHLVSTVHRFCRSWAQQIQAVVQQWNPVDEPPTVDRWPIAIDHRIPHIPVYDDGLLYSICERYICRQIKGLKNHWRLEHGFTPASHRGRPRQGQQQEIRDAIAQHQRQVLCQQLFPHGPGSHYIQAAGSTGATQPNRRRRDPDAVDQLIEEVRGYQRQDREAQRTVIQAGDLDEATPWLNRTGWIRYLQGIPRDPLFNSTARPSDEGTEGIEGAAWAIWQAMHRLATVS